MNVETVDILNALKKMPVFSLSDYAKLVENTYAKASLRRLVKKGLVHRVRRDVYTVYDDPLMVAPFTYRPSYIGGYSALHMHGLLDQIPKDMLCFTTRPLLKLKFSNTLILYKHTKNLFGYSFVEYKGFKIPVATPEKAFAESIGLIPFSLILPYFDSLDMEKMKELLLRLPKGKERRVAYLLHLKGVDVKVIASKRPILLDPLGPREGELDRSFNIIKNVRL